MSKWLFYPTLLICLFGGTGLSLAMGWNAWWQGLLCSLGGALLGLFFHMMGYLEGMLDAETEREKNVRMRLAEARRRFANRDWN